MNLQGLYRMIAFGIILLYVAFALAIFRLVRRVRPVPPKVKIPAAGVRLKKSEPA